MSDTFRFFNRIRENATSFASTGEPSENVASGARWNVYSVESSLMSHDSASPGINVVLSVSRPTSVW